LFGDGRFFEIPSARIESGILVKGLARTYFLADKFSGRFYKTDERLESLSRWVSLEPAEIQFVSSCLGSNILVVGTWTVGSGETYKADTITLLDQRTGGSERLLALDRPIIQAVVPSSEGLLAVLSGSTVAFMKPMTAGSAPVGIAGGRDRSGRF